jgi:hypothetical protein
MNRFQPELPHIIVMKSPFEEFEMEVARTSNKDVAAAIARTLTLHWDEDHQIAPSGVTFHVYSLQHMEAAGQ